MSPLVLILVGIVFLYVGGEALVGGARQLARRLGLTPLVIGLTVVAFGTSAPELATTLAAVLEGSPEVGVGNVVGSNIANLALVLALCALVYPIRSTMRFLRREMPFMLFASVLLMVFVLGGRISRIEGLVFLALLIGFVTYLLRRQEDPPGLEEEIEAELRGGPKPIWLSSAMVVAGLALLVGGAHFLVE
ncbi:MAG: sodium:calcium antiporter, partial [Thermoanaerobaculia bacterium]|nr:sodium:calcium antiporter [Thermoanaerobaculia bacterium]